MKSLINIKIVAGLALILLMISACTDHYEELNTGHDLVTEDVLDTDLLLTYVLHTKWISNGENGGGTIGNYPGLSVSNSNRPFQVVQASYGAYSVARNVADLIKAWIT